MPRKILLIEPNYKNKYPPIGLMKLATYHKMLGDDVEFFKGELKDLLIERRHVDCIKELSKITDIDETFSKRILLYLKSRKLHDLAEILDYIPLENKSIIESTIRFYAYKFLPTDYWQRIYITTLFTFYWSITIKTIEFAKLLVSDTRNIFIGGVMASLLKNEIEAATGITPYGGLLDKPGVLDNDNSLIIDELTLDYSILDEIDYKYPTDSAYFTFMTKGCTRKCAFCSVPKLEPTYKSKIETISKFNQVTETYGEQRNLLLMDNNVLASPNFPEIIHEIKQMGFYKGATFVEPNQLEIAIRNLTIGLNDKAFVRKSYSLINRFCERLRGSTKEKMQDLLTTYAVNGLTTTTKDNLIALYPHISDLYEKNRAKKAVLRFVDFNQGTDARYVNDDLMRLMSEIPIRPLRIAFDHIGITKQYVAAVELAAKYGIKELSNYILFNFQDKPEDFYNRLRINIELGKRLGINIFSFPMKYVPLFGEEAKDRKHIGPHWNRKFLRAIQCILNTTKGIVAPGYDFFENAFGADLDEFFEILYLPEQYIMNRRLVTQNGMKDKWRHDFNSLNTTQRALAKNVMELNIFNAEVHPVNDVEFANFLRHYSHSNDLSIFNIDEMRKLRTKFNRMIRKDTFKNLTLTCDFDGTEKLSA